MGGNHSRYYKTIPTYYLPTRDLAAYRLVNILGNGEDTSRKYVGIGETPEIALENLKKQCNFYKLLEIKNVTIKGVNYYFCGVWEERSYIKPRIRRYYNIVFLNMTPRGEYSAELYWSNYRKYYVHIDY